MKRYVGVVAVAIGLIVLTGCAAAQGMTAAGTTISSSVVSLPDGRTVFCVFAAGVSCDWENAK